MQFPSRGCHQTLPTFFFLPSLLNPSWRHWLYWKTRFLAFALLVYIWQAITMVVCRGFLSQSHDFGRKKTSWYFNQSLFITFRISLLTIVCAKMLALIAKAIWKISVSKLFKISSAISPRGIDFAHLLRFCASSPSWAEIKHTVREREWLCSSLC